MTKRKFKRYEYPLKDTKGNTYYGSYTIYAELEPNHLQGETLVQEFEAMGKE